MIRTAKTENGIVRGLPSQDTRVTVYKGIPYAAPPVGKNRWRAPQRCEDWEGELEAYKFGPISIQDTPGLGTDVYCREWNVDPDIPMSEDCLYLNVWTPAVTGEEKFPVLVWIYGGGFQWGYTAEMEFDAVRLARRGIVVVTMAYRLAALGFMAHPELTKEAPEAPANFGCLDQQAALKWVVRNIAGFGGDPENISLGGQSAGGASVMTQITCEDNYKDIKSAAIVSGIIRNPYWEDKFFIPGPLSAAEAKGEEFIKFLGVSSIEEARELDAIYIRDKYAEYAKDHIRFGICIDGQFCKGEPLNMLANNQCADIPLFVGNTEDEFIAGINAEDEEALTKFVKDNFGKYADDILALDETHVKSPEGYATISALEPAIKATIELKQERGSDKNCYYYRFASDIPGDDNLGTFHSVDLWFFFETLAKSLRPFVGRHYDLARKMCNYWVNFIKTGDPNGKDADGTDMPCWKPYSENDKNEMVFKSEGPVPGIDNNKRIELYKNIEKTSQRERFDKIK